MFWGHETKSQIINFDNGDKSNGTKYYDRSFLFFTSTPPSHHTALLVEFERIEQNIFFILGALTPIPLRGVTEWFLTIDCETKYEITSARCFSPIIKPYLQMTMENMKFQWDDRCWWLETLTCLVSGLNLVVEQTDATR